MLTLSGPSSRNSAEGASRPSGCTAGTGTSSPRPSPWTGRGPRGSRRRSPMPMPRGRREGGLRKRHATFSRRPAAFPGGRMAPRGKVFLVGAGPGSPDLLTVKAGRILGEAEVVLYDQLAGGVRDLLPAGAELIDCGKSGSRHTLEQDEIERIMVARALEGKRVVRLKGGDPFLFGRGGEELEALRAAGIPVEMVPGVSSALAVPASVGIPLTHRKYASQVTILTGNEDPTKPGPALDWQLLARSRGTIVILMGVANLARIVEALMRNGKPDSTPVAIIERGLRKERRVTTGPLATIADNAEKNGVKPPAVIVIGDVVRLYNPENPDLIPVDGRSL